MFVLFSCTRTPPTVPTDSDVRDLDVQAVTVLDVRVAAPKDDAEERPTDGYVTRYSPDLELTTDPDPQTIGMRFVNLTIPQNAIITNAYLQLHVDETDTEPTDLTLRGEATDDALEYSSAAFGISTRTPTNASVPWQVPPWNTVHEEGPDQQSPDLSPIVQEIVSRPNWASGNALALIVTGTGKRVAESYNGEPAGAPLLHVEYLVDNSTSVDAFSASPNPAAQNQQVTFSWTVSDADGDPVSCELDVDGDGSADYTIADCVATTSQVHAYPALGSYTATLTASDPSGSSDSDSTVVTVTLGVSDTLEVRVNGPTDDAEENLATGDISRFSPDLEMVDDGFDQIIGMRFPGVTIPQGAVIINAYVQFKVDEKNSAATTLTFQAQADDDPFTFSSSDFNVSSRPRSSASVPWSPPAWNTIGAAGPDQRSPDISSVVQEVIDRPGWSEGNAMVIFVTGSGKRVAESYNGDPAGAPLLHIDYSVDDSVTIADFAGSPNPAQPLQNVTFSWTVTDADGDPVSCELDVDGDGSADYTIADCVATTSQVHAYPGPGSFVAELLATDTTGAIDKAQVLMTVNTATTKTIVAAGDISCDPADSHFNGGQGDATRCHMQNTANLVAAANPDAVLLLGDVQYEEGTYTQFLNSYDQPWNWGQFLNITYPAVGNHEYITPNADGYFTYFGAAAGDPSKGYYSFDLGPWHLIALNTNCSKVGGCRAGSPQEAWLRADLAATTASCILAYWHHPRFSSGAIGGRDWSTDWWQALQEFGADVVLVGHDHNYERFGLQDPDGNADPTGLREFVVGTGGRNYTSMGVTQPNSEVRRSGSFGVLKMSLHPNSYDWEFLAEPGDSFTDTGNQACH